jgi:hypothetical protein
MKREPFGSLFVLRIYLPFTKFSLIHENFNGPYVFVQIP